MVSCRRLKSFQVVMLTYLTNVKLTYLRILYIKHEAQVHESCNSSYNIQITKKARVLDPQLEDECPEMTFHTAPIF